jgi:hypothetical protein
MIVERHAQRRQIFGKRVWQVFKNSTPQRLSLTLTIKEPSFKSFVGKA